jgi:hypothetical protein
MKPYEVLEYLVNTKLKDSYFLNTIMNYYEFEEGDLEDLNSFLFYQQNIYPIVFFEDDYYQGSTLRIRLENSNQYKVEALVYPPLKISWIEGYFPPTSYNEVELFPRSYQSDMTYNPTLWETPRVSRISLSTLADSDWRYFNRHYSLAVKQNNIQMYQDIDGEIGLEIKFQSCTLVRNVNMVTAITVEEYFKNPAKRANFETWNEWRVIIQDHFIRLKYQPIQIKTLNNPTRH